MHVILHAYAHTGANVNYYTIRISEQQRAIMAQAMADWVAKNNKVENPEIVWQGMMLRGQISNADDVQLSTTKVNDLVI